jgi:hypothetical protein
MYKARMLAATTAMLLLSVAPKGHASERVLLFADRDDANGTPDAEQLFVSPSPELFPIPHPDAIPALGGEGSFLDLTLSHASLQRTPPARSERASPSDCNDPVTMRFVVITGRSGVASVASAPSRHPTEFGAQRQILGFVPGSPE